MNCEYCSVPVSDSDIRAGKPDGLSKDVYVCRDCWSLLKNPATALQLIRGHLSLKLRDKVRPPELQKALNKYMGELSQWKPKN